MATAPGVRTASAFIATGFVSILALAALNIVADRTKFPGVVTLRNFLVKDRA